MSARCLPPLSLTPVQLVHAHREHLTEDEGRGGKATPGTRKGQAARQIKRESDPTDRTTTFPVHYHSEVSKRLTSCSTSARGVERRVHGTATRPLPSPERPAIPGHSLSVATSPRRPRTKANPAPRNHRPNATPADPARTRYTDTRIAKLGPRPSRGHVRGWPR